MHYGYIVDKAAVGNRNVNICAVENGHHRNRFVYQSKGSSVEIVLSTMLMDSDSNKYKFLIGLEGYPLSIELHASTEHRA